MTHAMSIYCSFNSYLVVVVIVIFVTAAAVAVACFFILATTEINQAPTRKTKAIRYMYMRRRNKQ